MLSYAGISGLCFRYCGEDKQRLLGRTMMWHALVALTAGTGIRLKLACDFFPRMAVLSLPSRPELVQRLTALAVCVGSADDLAVVFSLAALRHLRIGTPPASATSLLAAATSGSRSWECQLSQLRTLQLAGTPPAAFFCPGAAACLQQLHSLNMEECLLPSGVLPTELLRLQSLSRLKFMQLPLRMMPDLRGLPVLRELIVGYMSCELQLDASQADCSAELKSALRLNPLGGAMGLTAAVLHASPVVTQECAEAIARLPHLKLLGLDFTASVEGAFWAATLQRQMDGRCSVQSAFEYDICDGAQWQSLARWPDDDW